MSSGKIERIYLKNIENDFIFDESDIVTEHELQKDIFFKPKLNNKGLEKGFIYDPDKTYNCITERYFNMIKKIHLILKNFPDLTLKHKFAYCNSQRFYMKLYLKRISNRL
ncbi:MAG: hypothetical protein ACFFBV_00835 [Promethearchaeota archaeon]